MKCEASQLIKQLVGRQSSAEIENKHKSLGNILVLDLNVEIKLWSYTARLAPNLTVKLCG